ncbi:long-chain-fatty-acid--CoA ligase [Candidatus Chloroploca asiatica]|uniref:Long-chain fatty acid--CoA ligase n=1 Tax=Candidatus Chloroploca asiatica TaxID=1506545 RepID=A0A2H3KHM3_9CHLR|nr:long-chain fatty acid--CoA ligase [Candidatus Chloroploca asiatica]PDV97284.1 long-chain fatty acid--CoA ligase [Candidatus Chloroploca asiatica]
MEKPWLAAYEQGVAPNLTYPQQTLSDLLRETARRYPEHTATNFVLKYILGGRFTVGGKLNYKQLDTLVDRMATAMYQLGVRKGERVGLMLPNSPHYLITFFAAMRIGAVVVNINPVYTSRELQQQLADAGAETIVLLNLFWPRLREIRPETSVKRVIIAHVFDTLKFPSSLLVKRSQQRSAEWVEVRPEQDIFFFSDLLRYPPTPPKVDIDPDEVALFQYTGGTTGLPKAAMLSHKNLIANVTQVDAWVVDGQPGREKLLAAIPFFHVYGMTTAMLYGIRLGAEIVTVPNPRPIENVMRIIAAERCTIFPGVPAMYIGIINHKDVASYDLRSVRVCVSGSAPLPVQVQEHFEALTGGRLVEGYGLSEASPLTHGNPVHGRRKVGSIGVPFPDTDARLVELETGANLPFDDQAQGELCVRGPQVMRGYWQRPEETAEAIDAEGWLHTGDICKADPEGYFYVVDRKKDMIIASGFKVLPRDVEEVLYMHPSVMEAVVAGIPHPARGDDTVKAFIVAKPDTNPTAEEIRAFCALHLAHYKIPREIEFRDDLPRTIVGKVLRRLLIEEEQTKQQPVTLDIGSSGNP